MKNGAYDLEGVIWHQHSNHLMKAILELWPDKTVPVVDLGCGHNFYVTVLNYAGYAAVGFDNVDLGSRFFLKADLTERTRLLGSWNIFNKGHKPPNVISLEVGEHIPEEHAAAYLDHVASFGGNVGGNVLMSWAIPGQAGVGHINCKSNAWVMDQMKARAYEPDFQITHDLRQAVATCHCSWFKHTLMYFKPV